MKLKRDEFYILTEPLDPDCRKTLRAFVQDSQKPLSWEDLGERMFETTGYALSAYVLNWEGLRKWSLFSDLAFALEIEDPGLNRLVSEELAAAEKPGRLDWQTLSRNIRRQFQGRIWIDAFVPVKKGFELEGRFRINISRLSVVPEAIPERPLLYAVQ